MGNFSLHAILPRLSSKLGHIFHYHEALQEGLNANQWCYTAYIPKKADIFPLPSNWNAVLANDIADSSKSFFQKLTILFANIVPFWKIFRSFKKDKRAVVFIEHFELQHLASFFLVLLCLRPKFQFWILFRYEFEEKKLKLFLTRLFLRFLEWKLIRIKCLTDSDLLAEVLEKELMKPIFVVPIPHTDQGHVENRKKASNRKLFWWPGGLIREDKGLSKIGHLLGLLKTNDQIQILVAEKARDIFGMNPSLQYISTHLSRREYVEWIQNVDLILLPYLSSDYSRRTSGIFVEAIFLGAIPVVTKGTWMAYELNKFNLPELTFDWTETNLLERLTNITIDDKLQSKLAHMRSKYQQFHTRQGLAATFDKITQM